MGTSQSYRSPQTARWAGFVAALTAGVELDRVRSELFNAGNEWQEALSQAAVQSYAMSVASLHSELSGRLASAERPEVVVSEVLAEARRSSHEAGFSPAAPIADRAFARLILSTLGGIEERADGRSTPAERWEAARGSDASVLLSRFVGEVLGQFARHAADREAGRELGTSRSATSSSALSDALALQAAAVGQTTSIESAERALSLDGWSSLIRRAFEAGRTLPRSSR
jgi:hypothetical protein